tara:strand:- start:45 stop:488 length:444 start_codon:yes stop_codon:yes gene_type:complete
MPRKKQTQKQEQRAKLMKMFPDAMAYMEAALRDKLPEVKHKKVYATVGQKLEICHRIIDQVVGKPAQAVQLGGDAEQPPIRHVEVRKAYAAPPETQTSVPSGDGQEETPSAVGGSRQDWLNQVEEEAVQAASEANDKDDYPIWDDAT